MLGFEGCQFVRLNVVKHDAIQRIADFQADSKAHRTKRSVRSHFVTLENNIQKGVNKTFTVFNYMKVVKAEISAFRGIIKNKVHRRQRPSGNAVYKNRISNRVLNGV